MFVVRKEKEKRGVVKYSAVEEILEVFYATSSDPD
jgi:hypothetical protein